MFTIERPLISLDLETTGLDPKTDRIMELGMVILYPGGEQKEFECFINPGIPIPPDATRATTNEARPTGITNAMVADAFPFSHYAPNLAENLGNADFIGFNIRQFDLPFMHYELVRAGYPNVGLRNAKVIDCMKIYHEHKRRDLTQAVRDYLNEQHDGHGALIDAKNTLRVALQQLEQHKLPRTPAAIHDLFFGDTGDRVAGGMFIWKGDELLVNFGKFKDTPLKKLGRSYLEWICDKSSMAPEVKELCKEALSGRYPNRR